MEESVSVCVTTLERASFSFTAIMVNMDETLIRQAQQSAALFEGHREAMEVSRRETVGHADVLHQRLLKQSFPK